MGASLFFGLVSLLDRSIDPNRRYCVTFEFCWRPMLWLWMEPLDCGVVVLGRGVIASRYHHPRGLWQSAEPITVLWVGRTANMTTGVPVQLMLRCPLG